MPSPPRPEPRSLSPRDGGESPGGSGRPLVALLLPLALLLVVPGTIRAQIWDEVRDAAEEVLDHGDIVDDLLEGEDPVSTAFSDAVTETTFLDPYQPDAWKALSRLPRGRSNLFRIGPGRFEFVSQSYCLKAGTHGPSGGDGYLWAPLRGARAEIVRAILLRSADHPEIPQRTIQQILWAIVARTDFSEMSLDLQRAAAALLSPEELLDLEGGALGLVRDEVLERAIREMPEPARKVLRAEARLRRLLTEADATYEQMEEVAVLAGAAPAEDEIREVPAARWSYHPDGYFVRYRPHGYQRLRIQVYAPEAFDVERDAAGRITALSNGNGERIEIAYDRPPGEVADGSGPSVHRIRSVRFRRTRVVGPEIVVNLEREWEAAGWTIVGPVDRSDPPGSLIASAPAGARQRWRRARAAVAEAERLREAAGRGDPAPESRRDVGDLGHLALALSDALDDRIAEDSAWVRDHGLLAREAWAWAACRYAGGCAGETGRVSLGSEAEHVRRYGTTPPFSLGPTLADPPGGPSGCAVPANTSAQRLCPSPRNGGTSGGGPGAGGPGNGGPGDGGPGDGGPSDGGPGDGGPGDGGPGDGGPGDGGPGDGGPGDGGPGDGGPGDGGPDDGPDDGPPDDIDRPEPEDSDDEPDEQTCQEVRKRRDDMEIARDAFADPETLEQAERNRLPGVSGNEYSYQDMIADEVGKAYDRMREARGEKATGDPAGAAMSTDASCQVSAPGRSSYTENGTPGVVWDAERWHEQVHRDNCKADPDWYDGLREDPEKLSREEVEAYDESIEVLDDYLDAHCD